MIKVAILTEGGIGIGLGHITRCLSLYQSFEQLNIIPLLIINSTSKLDNIFEEQNFTIIDWINNKEIFDIIADYEIIIIDSYLANTNFYEYISKNFKLAIFFDDYNRIRYPKGTIVNGSIFSKEINYPKSNYLKYILGTEYIPIRKEFWQVENKQINSEIKNIFITLGGDDVRNITPRIINILSEYFPDIEKNIIVNSNFNNIEEIKKNSDSNTKAIFSPSPSYLKKLMFDADLAISSAGQTLYELCRVGVPTIMISVADNQEYNVKGWIESGVVEYVGDYNNNNLNKELKSLVIKMKSLLYRKDRSTKAQSLINGQGSKKIVEQILEQFI